MVIRQYPLNEPHSREILYITLGALALLVVLAGTLWYIRSQTYALALIAGTAFMVGAAWRPWVLPLLYLALICLIPAAGKADYLGFPFAYTPYFFPPLFGAMILLLWSGNVLDPGQVTREKQSKHDGLGTIIHLFLAYSAFNFLRGIAVGNDLQFMFYEISFALMYAGYFYWRSYFRKRDSIMNWNWVILGLAVLTGIEFTLLLAQSFTDVLSFVMFRVLTRQNQVVIAAVPLVIMLFLIQKGTWGRIGSAGLALLLVLYIFVSQQRSLWVAVAAIVFTFFTLYVFRHGISFKRTVRWLSLIVLASAFFTATLFVATWLLQTDITVLLARWQDVESLRDSSFLIRVFDLRKAVEAVGDNWLWGLGGGKLHSWVHTGVTFYYFDISYGIAYFKGGIILAGLLTSIYIGAIIQGLRLYFRNIDMKYRIYGIVVVSAMVGEMLIGAFSSSMMYYRFIFIWVMMMASVTVLLEKTTANK